MSFLSRWTRVINAQLPHRPTQAEQDAVERNLTKSEQRVMSSALKQTFRILPDPEVEKLKAELKHFGELAEVLTAERNDLRKTCQILEVTLRLALDGLCLPPAGFTGSVTGRGEHKRKLIEEIERVLKLAASR